MFISDVLKISFRNVVRGRIRSVLTCLSITVSVAAFLLVSSIGEGGKRVVLDELSKTGLGGIAIRENTDENSTPLLAEDAELLKENFESISEVLPVVIEYGGYSLGRSSGDNVLLGVGENADDVYDVTLLHGRIPNKADITSKNKAAVIDEELAIKSYGRSNVTGKKITIRFNGYNEEFKIIGVIKSQKDGINGLFGGIMPELVYVPYSALNAMRGKEELSQITVKCIASADEDESAKRYISYISRLKKHKNGYLYENISSKIDDFEFIMNMITLLISSIAAISLCIAGLGIMNSMFSSSVERRGEIGICLAIGASETDILVCFLAESLIISLIGGFAGAVAGVALVKLIENVIKIKMSYELSTFLYAEIISVLLGVVFSIIPARKAAKADPITSLRDD